MTSALSIVCHSLQQSGAALFAAIDNCRRNKILGRSITCHWFAALLPVVLIVWITLTSLSEPDLYSACKTGNLGRVQQLIRSGAVEVNQLNKNGYSPLLNACFNAHLEVVKYLITEAKAESTGQARTGFHL